jgi:NAD(P)-dependent dehydrogenase (short-subunit alcohol dehydrogenase family)
MTPEDFNVIGVGCDVSSELSVQRAFEQVMDTFGRLDSVVASAGKFRPSAALFSQEHEVMRCHVGRNCGELLCF